MARLPRYCLPGHLQHVIQRGTNRCRVFSSDDDHQVFIALLARACGLHAACVHAYVLMPNHVHLLVTPQHENSLGKMMQSVTGRFARYFNARYDRTGTLWQGRFKSIPIETERYALTCHRYIELNPVRAGLAVSPERYEWSSYRANAFGMADRIVTPHLLYHALGATVAERRSAYRALLDDPMDGSTLGEIRESTQKGWALGSERFRDSITRLGSRRALPLSRGRRSQRKPIGV